VSCVAARELRDCAVRQGLLDGVVSDAGVELYYLDCQGRIVDCNPAAQRALGRSIPELEGRPLFAAYSGWEDPGRRQRESLAVIESGALSAARSSRSSAVETSPPSASTARR